MHKIRNPRRRTSRRWRRRGTRLIKFELHPGAAIPLTLGKKMRPVAAMIERMRERPDVGIVEEAQSWKIMISKGKDYLCEVTVPHLVLEWFACVRDRKSKSELWSDWMDYEGYDDSTKDSLEESMAYDVESFVDRTSKQPINLPLQLINQEA